VNVTVRYFAWVREGIGLAEEQVALDAPEPLAAFVARLAERSDGHGRVLAEASRLRAALNQEHVPMDAIVRQGDEVALFPPVTGG
jgi:molybdopterin synthase sulfur carrier subunit